MDRKDIARGRRSIARAGHPLAALVVPDDEAGNHPGARAYACVCERRSHCIRVDRSGIARGRRDRAQTFCSRFGLDSPPVACACARVPQRVRARIGVDRHGIARNRGVGTDRFHRRGGLDGIDGQGKCAAID
jgi:hypothetical protein